MEPYTVGDRRLGALLAAVGVALGAGILESRTVIPVWAAEPYPDRIGPALARSGHLRAGTQFWPYIGIPVLALTAVNLHGAARSTGARRPWWLACSATTATLGLATLGYYVPSLHRLDDAGWRTGPQVRRMVARRVRLDRVRLLVGALAWYAGFRALIARD